MSRYFFTLLLLLCSRLLFAQTVEVKRSGDLITIRGESYYLHVVDAGQSLYAIGKAYGVPVETILKVNRKETPALSVFEVLKIPYVEPVETPAAPPGDKYVERDETYYYHIAQKGETLYSLSRQYGVKPRRILQENRQYEANPLAVGSVVRLPLAEMRKEAIPQVELPPEEVVPERDSISGAAKEEPEVPVGAVKVAVLLPFHAKNTLRNNTRPERNDTLNTWKYTPGIVPKWEGFLNFYEGLLLAADSLKRAGFRMELYTYDTEYFSDGTSLKMHDIAGELNREHPDLIIGPVYGSEYRILQENLENKQIPVVYPLSARSEGLGKHPNFIQVNTPAGAVAEQAAAWIAARPARVICFHFPGDEYREEAAVVRWTEQKMRLTDSLSLPEQIPGRFYTWRVDGSPMDSLAGQLDPDRENILVIPTTKEAEVSKLLPMLSSFAATNRITVIGLPDWQNFTSVDFETFYKLNVTFFSYSFIDNFSEAAKAFADRYREWFGTEPHTLSNKAFDIGLYFIPLAARFKGGMLEAVGANPRNALFSSFRFNRFGAESGWENRGLLLIRYASDYTIRTERVN